MSLTPNQWVGVTVDSYTDVSNTYPTYGDIVNLQRFEFTSDNTVELSPATYFVECIGGGGCSNLASTSASHGGGGASYAASTIVVSTTETFTVAVGQGGTPSTFSTHSEFIDSGDSVLVRGARGGLQDPDESSIGDTIYLGGSGANRISPSGSGGGGGGAGGPRGPGYNGRVGASNVTHAPGGRGNNKRWGNIRGRGGHGGMKQIHIHPENGEDGYFPGAAGGGSGNANVETVGGSGANGLVRITEVVV